MRLFILHYVAKALGVLIHIDGLPFGSTRNGVTRLFGHQGSTARGKDVL